MPVLVALNSADTALDIEGMSDQEAVAEALGVRTALAWLLSNWTVAKPLKACQAGLIRWQKIHSLQLC